MNNQVSILTGESCFYCVVYNNIYENYPINKAIFNELNDLTPRCNLHWQYKCNKCNISIHFNGIAYCENCDYYTCVKCGEEKLERKKFFYYDYYYEIKCGNCSNYHPSLDYLEFIHKHPAQTGKVKFGNQIILLDEFRQEKPEMDISQKPWGSNRITSMAINNNQIELTDENNVLSKDIWNEKSKKWMELMPEEGDFHHREIINPALFKLLKLEDYEQPNLIKILDVACGSGEVTRKIAKLGFDIMGLDISDELIKVAKAKNNEFNLDISYLVMDATKIIEEFTKNSFDIIYCNMALMDMDHFEEVLSAISKVLKENGIFVFSVSHPIFSWPVAQTIRIPKDSQRNEDKFWVIDRYWRKKTLVKTVENTWLYYPKTISQYFNECIKNNLQIMQVAEPEVTLDDVNKFPRDNYFDNDRRPDFLLIKTKKKNLNN